MNPDDRPAPVSRRVHDSGPSAPLRVSIKSDPPQLPLAFSFDDERAPEAAPSAAITEPEPEPEAEPELEPKDEPTIAQPRAAAGWFSDSFAIAALSLGSLFACAVAAVQLGQVRYPLDFLRDTSTLWLVLFGLLSLAWSAFFTLRRAVV